MCGIFFCIFKDGQCCKKRIEHLTHSITPLIRRRGPDDFNTKEKILSDHESGQTYKLILMGAVLHLRGSLTPQPLEDDKGNVLIWNGEVFDGIHIPEDSNDTSILSHLLGNHSNSDCHVPSIMSCIQGPWSFVYFQASEGKLWFGRDYFGRRSLVWHLPRNNEDIMAVSSLAQRSDEQGDIGMVWEEVPADGLYCLESNSKTNNQKQLVETFNFNCFKLKKYPWTLVSENLESDDNIYVMQAPVKPFNKELPSESDLECLENELKQEQRNGLREGVQCSSQLSVCTKTGKTRTLKMKDPFVKIESESDTNDINSCEVGECLTHEHVKLNVLKEKVELEQKGIDCFSTFVTNHPTSSQPTKVATLYDMYTLKELCSKAILSTSKPSSRKLTDSCINVDSAASFLKARGIETLRQSISESLPESFIWILGEAVRKRVFNLPRFFSASKKQEFKYESHGLTSTATPLTRENEQLLTKEIHGSTNEDSTSRGQYHLGCSRVGVLFSGGIDSIVLAALADRFIPKTEAIDLINVAFEQKVPKQNPTNKRKAKPSALEEERLPSFDVPDRLTGRSGVLELNTINPERMWNFIEVNVNLKDLQEARSERITHLVSPLNSVLDDSIGCALWFAAGGSGVLRCPRCIMRAAGDITTCVHPYKYTSKAKVLLVGMGADEQLGGYARHRTKFNQQGWLGLVDEMEMEVNRISERNLGRDDRCISDHGREARFPFLDEQVVSFLSTLPVWLKTDPRLPRGTGEKILLRQAAKLLGLTSSAVLPKRAIQFGSRIAKLEGTNEKGSDACLRLKSK